MPSLVKIPTKGSAVAGRNKCDDESDIFAGRTRDDEVLHFGMGGQRASPNGTFQPAPESLGVMDGPFGASDVAIGVLVVTIHAPDQDAALVITEAGNGLRQFEAVITAQCASFAIMLTCLEIEEQIL